MTFWENNDHQTCYYCKLHHPRVEAGGIWHCPNPLCKGPGAQVWRMKCKSYQELPNESHTVDSQEIVAIALEMMAKEPDEVLKAHVLNCVPNWTCEKENTEVVRTATGVCLIVEQEE